MTDIQIFENPEFGKIRATEIDGEPWFVGKDVTNILGYTNASKALTDHVDEDDKLNNVSLSSLGQRGGWLINESGLYSLILGSKLPGAKKFKHWVTSEVLPAIRKTGGYHLPATYSDALRQLADQVEKNERLLLDNKVKSQQIEELQPKATYYDLVLQTKDAIAITKIAKDYGKSARWLNSLLKDLHVQYKQGDAWFLYQKYADKGYTQTKTDTFVDTKGEPHTKIRTCWTQKGRLFIYELLKEHNILPLIEREELKA